jgi:hypothetical protein
MVIANEKNNRMMALPIYSIVNYIRRMSCRNKRELENCDWTRLVAVIGSLRTEGITVIGGGSIRTSDGHREGTLFAKYAHVG